MVVCPLFSVALNRNCVPIDKKKEFFKGLKFTSCSPEHKFLQHVLQICGIGW